MGSPTSSAAPPVTTACGAGLPAPVPSDASEAKQWCRVLPLATRWPLGAGLSLGVRRHVDLIVVVDPQLAFASPVGTLARAVGVKDHAPVVRTSERLSRWLARLSVAVPVIVVRSEYQLGQFATDGPLRELAVPGLDPGCGFADGLAPKHHWTVLTKRVPDACSQPDFEVRMRALPPGTRVGICGFMLTTCVRASALSLARLRPDLRIEVPVSLCAIRRSSQLPHGGPSRLKEVLDELRRASISTAG